MELADCRQLSFPDLEHSLAFTLQKSSRLQRIDTTIGLLRSFAPLDSRRRLSLHGRLMPQAFYRRKLPHLQVDDKPHFVTFCTYKRWVLPERIRGIVLESCLHDNGTKYDLKVAVVMPHHLHLIFTPLVNRLAMEVCSLAEIMDAVKGARRIA